MKRYIALLRGINISGKNKISMAELKTGFAEAGYTAVSTYLNSGNVAFDSDAEDKGSISENIMAMIKDRFELDIPVLVILQEELAYILANAPKWWESDDKDIYDNLIFMFPSVDYDRLYSALGEPKAEYERVYNYKNAVFWSFVRKDYRKTNWWAKTAREAVGSEITIRTASTVRKLLKL